MSSDRLTSSNRSSPETKGSWVTRLPGISHFNQLRIGRKLSIGFGTLVFLIFLVVGLSFLASREATASIEHAEASGFPSAVVAARAEATLLKMLADARAYLALGDAVALQNYDTAEEEFAAMLAQFNATLNSNDPHVSDQLVELSSAFQEWQTLRAELFALREDRLLREPAYRLLMVDGTTFAGAALLKTRDMIDQQVIRDSAETREGIILLQDMSDFQISLANMLSGLRNYVTTQNSIFRQEYEANWQLNQDAWERLMGAGETEMLTEPQLALLTEIGENRDAFLALPEKEIFPILESDQRRQDFLLFTTEAEPLNQRMVELIEEINIDQRDELSADLTNGKDSLNQAVTSTLGFGLVALLAGIAMAFTLREAIAGPIQRLTGVAERIRDGDLESQAQVESRDEIGTLAGTFNGMTDRLRTTLWDVTREKERADNLLNVVIPIGVDLSAEQDFNRLLEKIVVEAQEFCHASSGVLLLRTEDEQLQSVIVRNSETGVVQGGTSGVRVEVAQQPLFDAATETPLRDQIATDVVHSGTTINIPDISLTTRYQDKAVAAASHKHHIRSVLALPLKNVEGRVLGVLQLSNAHDPQTGDTIPFDDSLQQMMESFSSLAVAALEAYIREQALRQEIRELRVEIDESRKTEQVQEIVETDFFAELQKKADTMRQRKRQRHLRQSADTEDTNSAA